MDIFCKRINCISTFFLEGHQQWFYRLNIVSVDYPSNQKWGAIFIYHKDFSPVKVNNAIYYLNECLNFHLILIGKQCNTTLIYRSRSQLLDEFHTFLKFFELLQDNIANWNPFVNITIDDFNAWSKNWCSGDKTIYEGKNLESLTSQIRFEQVVSDPTHVLENSSLCIGLIFTSQPNLVMNSGVHSSLQPNPYHQIIPAKFNLQVFCPPPYERVVWHNQDANKDIIQQSISQFD